MRLVRVRVSTNCGCRPEPWRDEQRQPSWLGRKRGGVGLRELGQLAGGLDYTSVSLAVKRFEKRRGRLKRLQEMADRAEKALETEMSNVEM